MGLMKRLWSMILKVFRGESPEQKEIPMLPMLEVNKLSTGVPAVQQTMIDLGRRIDAAASEKPPLPESEEPVQPEFFIPLEDPMFLHFRFIFEKPKDPREEMPLYWRLRDRSEMEEQKLVQLLRTAKHAKRKRIKKRYIGRARRQNKRLQTLYKQIRKIEMEDARNEGKIENPLFY